MIFLQLVYLGLMFASSPKVKVADTKWLDTFGVYKKVVVYYPKQPKVAELAVFYEGDAPASLYEYPQTKAWALSDSSASIFLIDKRYRLPSDFVPKNLVKYVEPTTGEAFYINKDTLKAFLRFKDHVYRNYGITLFITSAYRSYYTQKGLFSWYSSAFGYNRAVQFSAKPGHSQHQTGRVVDVGLFWKGRRYVLSEVRRTPFLNIVKKDAYKFGFVGPYISYRGKNITQVTGYVPEPWHLYYVGEENAHEFILTQWEFMEYVKHKLAGWDTIETI